MPVENEITLEEGLKLLYGKKKSRKRIRGVPTGAERKAGEYLLLSRSCQGDGKNGDSRLLYEPFTVRMGTVSYKPDWVVERNPFDRECFEVKNPNGKWKGFRDREAKVKLELLRRLGEEFGWRVFLLLVEGNKIEEREIH